MIRLGLTLALVSCAASPPRKPVPSGRFCLTGVPGDAQIYLSDALLAPGQGRKSTPIVLPVGSYRLEVRADGHFAVYRDVEVVLRQGECIQVVMHPIADGEAGD